MMQKLSAARTDMVTVVEGFFDGTLMSEALIRDCLVVCSLLWPPFICIFRELYHSVCFPWCLLPYMWMKPA